MYITHEARNHIGEVTFAASAIHRMRRNDPSEAASIRPAEQSVPLAINQAPTCPFRSPARATIWSITQTMRASIAEQNICLSQRSVSNTGAAFSSLMWRLTDDGEEPTSQIDRRAASRTVIELVAILVLVAAYVAARVWQETQQSAHGSEIDLLADLTRPVEQPRRSRAMPFKGTTGTSTSPATQRFSMRW